MYRPFLTARLPFQQNGPFRTVTSLPRESRPLLKARVRVGSFNKLSFVEGYREARHVKGLMLPVLR